MRRERLCYSAAIFRVVALAALLVGLQAHAADEGYFLDNQEWARPRDGLVIAQMPAIRDAVQALSAAPGGVLQIRYPGGDEGSLWAHELQGWLVALGVSSRHIELLPGSPRADALYLQVSAERARPES
jgi:hypothetical protein